MDRTTQGYDAHVAYFWLTSLKEAFAKDKIYLQLFAEDGEEVRLK